MALPEDDPLLQEALKIFEEEGYEYLVKLGAGMIWVANKSGRRYAFYPTTGRWAPYGNSKPNHHYRSRGARDFVDRFLKPNDQVNKVIEEDRKKLMPSGVKSPDLMEFLEFAYEMFEDGLSFKDVYYGIKSDHAKKFLKELNR